MMRKKMRGATSQVLKQSFRSSSVLQELVRILDLRDLRLYLVLTSVLLSEIDGGDCSKALVVFDHQPLHRRADDFERICQIPKKQVLFYLLMYLVS